MSSIHIHITQPTMATNAPCYTIVHDDLLESSSINDLRNALQKGSDEVKLETMRTIIVGTLNGQNYVRVGCSCSLRLTRP